MHIFNSDVVNTDLQDVESRRRAFSDARDVPYFRGGVHAA